MSKGVNKDSASHNYFLEYLVDGIVSLYYLKLDDVYFIERDNELIQLSNKEQILTDADGRTYQKTSNQFRGAILFMTQDNPEFSDVVTQTTFDQNSLIKTTVKYHNAVCDDFECMNYSKGIKPKLYIEPVAGLNTETMSIRKYSGTDFSIRPTVGVNFILVPSHSDNEYGFSIGLHYLNQGHDAEYKNEDYSLSGVLGYHLVVENHSLRVPLCLDYNFGKQLNRNYLIVGVDNVFSFSSDVYVGQLSKNNGGSELEVFQGSKMPNYQLGFILGYKYKIETSELNRLSFGIQYEYMTPLTVNGNVIGQLYFHTVNISLGYEFRIN